ncbi:MAG: amino acid adenylation domain-containing protein [Reyranella sp.]|uniref:non-ribosomal peptide synthetase/type I polyketide synthase n=1 Tax=Reyranella sp. TaxID=1929291 RepID=UPI001224765C|nr:non-ribosomal peptide synthetase/type I polyketide synthase [Reyranella sp.]TAJ38189.1 MAG: amino acid adenylation domain-containing protein [Reyranella sp.]
MSVPDNAIAIIGLAGRFPGADDVDQFWANIRAGTTSISRFSDAELEDAFPNDIRKAANFVRARPILANVDLFDAEFFGMLPREAALTDPQHRLLLECAWSALEDASYDPARFPGAIGVFAGCSMNTYLLTNVLAERLDPDRFVSDYQVGSYDTLLGALPDTLATRIAYKLNLRGPAMTVQSACSTSLLAIAEACQSLLLYQSDMALAGGVSITFPQKRGYQHQEGGMVSPDGACRPFDDAAAGTVFGDGAGIVLLKRLADAIEDRDHIYAVIRGSAVNNDGSDKVGFTAPSVRGQADVIASALASAGVDAGSIGYVECHGTATALGDPIEFAGLVRGFGSTRVERPHCALGSAKANVGHLDAASGAAGLIKTALALHHHEIPPLANFHRPNRHINLAGTPFYFPTAPVAWPQGRSPRRAGVSSFGVGGTNVHIVLEEAPSIAPARDAAHRRHVLPLSARNDAALAAAAAALADHLATSPETALEDVAHTLQTGRRAFDRRAAVTCSSHEQAIEALRALPALPTAPPTTPGPGERPPLIFLFPGQGAQYPGMAHALYRDHASFRTTLDAGIAIAEPIVGADLRAQLLEPAATGGDATLLAQPALFVFEYALAKLWMSWGLEPDAMVGHSVGEFVAACLAGVFSFEEGCRLVATRARIMQGMAPGAMLAVRLPESELRAELGDTIDLAAINAPSLCVASGPIQEIEALSDRLTARGVACQPLAVSHAFHSRALDPVVAQIEKAAGATQLATPRMSFVSCVTGDWADAAQATDPKYWAHHGRAPVRFADAVSTVARDGHPFLLEVGPGHTLSALAAQVVDRKRLRGITASLADAETDDLGDALTALWRAGFSPDWTAAADTQGSRVPLPTYRFQRKRHWIERSDKRSTITSLPAPVEPPVAHPSDVPAAPGAPPAHAASRIDTLQAAIIAILEELSGVSDIDPRENFVALGFDSLLLGQVARALEKKFKIRITFRQLLSDMPSVARLAAHLESILPLDPSLPAAVAPAPRIAAPVAVPAPREEANARIRLQHPSAGSQQDLTASQRLYIEDLVRRVNARTPLSKARTEQDRAVLADPRTVAGFRREWKELVYPVIAARAKGSKIWDIDGNEYVDLVNGYGQTMFGHSPDFVTSAIAAQLQEGFPIGPQSSLAGEVAALVSEMTGDERVTFCNTGSEAVMAAMRVARAVTGRERVVVFGNDYHGQFDEVLVKAGGATRRALPVAPGIPPEAVANMTVLPYGDPQSLEWIDTNGDDIAAVLVEPVQSRHPELRPRAFLQRLRAITEARGAALVFDEIVTGFRAHPGGMQALFGIRADLATYGKVVGGGMPVGILAGKARFMDALDGGTWRFGDDSVPEVAPTFFAGTFVRHPLVLAATKAVLLHLKAEGPALQERLAQRMGGLVDAVNRDLERRGLATRAEGFSSWFHLSFAAEHPLAALFWPQMRLLGVHVQEAYPCFLTTAHSDADIATIENAFKATLDALEAAGILTATRQIGRPSPIDLPPVEPDQAPLTDPQLEILTAAQMSDEASCAFNESISISFDGEIDAAALAAALNAVIARHQALRGRIGRADERMHFAPSLVLDLEAQDCSRERDPEAALAACIAADARTPFDLWAGPLVRAMLVRLAKDRHVLLFTVHHIVCDGWSTNIILRDLAAYYRLSHAGQPATLPAAPHFARYALAQAASKDLQAVDLRYWTSLYSDLPALPDLPTDRPRPPQRSYAGATYSIQFDAGLFASLKKVGAGYGVTVFSTLFTALQTVLGRLAGATDIVIGVPVAGQSADDEPDLVGHCVQMLPFRAPLVWNAPFGAHVHVVARRLLDGFDHPKCTYGTLVRALPLQRAANRLPLMEVQFNLERMAEALDFGGPAVRVTPNAKAAVNFDIFVNVIESGAGLRIDCDYNTDLFDEATIARWMTHYRRILEGIGAAPETPLSALPVLSAEQERFILDVVNDSAAPYPRENCIHDLFAQQVAKTPDDVACIDGAGAMSYAELDRQSTRLAQEILGVSIVRRGRIAVAVDRSRALPVALLAVMKAGHAYVPFDVHQPLDRLRQIATAAQIDGIICQDERIRSIAPYAFALRMDQLDLNERLDGHKLPRVPADDSAYILFTSGSTGMPKGVEVGHRALTNAISDVVRRCDVTAADVAIASSAITFDVAAAELYAPLIVGGRLVLAESDVVRTGFELEALARKAGATLMQATPTLWRMLLEAGFSSRPGLKMITAGEAISRDVVDRLLSGGGRLWNLYGPTEATIYSSGCEMHAGAADVTIGKPLANTQLYVLDDRDGLVPAGAVGELFIGGDGLAKGYFDRSDFTVQSFRTISLAGRAAQRLYRTGDLARLLPSGNFELRGRVDHQVKLRGFRIELEEIESVLRQAPGVRDCAVLLRSDAGPDPALVAYVVAADGTKPAEFAAHLASRLPDYMVPARWLGLEALPLTPNGKIDRNVLPPPAPAATETATPATALPRTPLEARIATVWANVIGRQEVGIHDPLFALGADSLQVFRIAAQLDQIGIAVSARELMKNPTVAALAGGLEGRPDASHDASGRKGPSLADFRRGARRHTVKP